MFMAFLEIKHGVIATVTIAAGVLALLLVVSGVHLLMREIGRTLRRRRAGSVAPAPHRSAVEERLGAGIGD